MAEKPLVLIAPHCPWCGLAAMWDKPIAGHEHAPIAIREWVVLCVDFEGCGWRGQSRRYFAVVT